MIIDETERLIIKEFDEEEFTIGCECFNMFDDEGHEYTIDMMKAYKELAYGFFGYGYYGLFLKDGTPVGCAGFREGSCPPEIGYALFPKYRGMGLATEAVQSLTEWAMEDFLWCLEEEPAESFNELGSSEERYIYEYQGKPLVYAKIDKKNIKSARVLERCGYVKK